MGIQIKKFQAPTIQKALEQIRAELGDNAIILQTEPVRTTGVAKLLHRNLVEVTAAIDRKELPPRFHATVSDESSHSSQSAEKKGWFKLGNLKVKNSSTPAKETTAQEVAAAVKQVAKKAKEASAQVTKESDVTSETSLNQLYAMKTFVEPLQKEIETLKERLAKTTSKKGRVKDPLEEEVQSLRRELFDFVNEQRFEKLDLHPYFRSLIQFWSNRGLTSKQIYSFLREAQKWGIDIQASCLSASPKGFASALEGTIQEANVFEKPSRRIVILVGPTGVGKTTTIAKLAAFEKLKLQKTVTLVTVDDYKIGGTDQLAHYARILDVPFLKARSDRTLDEQIRLLPSDTIFIDTFGVSVSDQERIQNLSRLIRFQDEDAKARSEVHFVLPVGVSASDVPKLLDAFSELKPEYLLFTKWDETSNWGGMLWSILSSRKPVSFVGHGQNVPDDLALFSKRNFIETVTGSFGME